MQTKLSAADVKKLKDMLLSEDIRIQETIPTLKSRDPFNDPDHVNDNAAVDTDVREQLDHDTIVAEVEALEKKQKLVHAALAKMDKGTYGICEKSGKQIPLARLMLVPEARYLVEFEQQLVR